MAKTEYDLLQEQEKRRKKRVEEIDKRKEELYKMLGGIGKSQQKEAVREELARLASERARIEDELRKIERKKSFSSEGHAFYKELQDNKRTPSQVSKFVEWITRLEEGVISEQYRGRIESLIRRYIDNFSKNKASRNENAIEEFEKANIDPKYWEHLRPGYERERINYLQNQIAQLDKDSKYEDIMGIWQKILALKNNARLRDSMKRRVVWIYEEKTKAKKKKFLKDVKSNNLDSELIEALEKAKAEAEKQDTGDIIKAINKIEFKTNKTFDQNFREPIRKVWGMVEKLENDTDRSNMKELLVEKLIDIYNEQQSDDEKKKFIDQVARANIPFEVFKPVLAHDIEEFEFGGWLMGDNSKLERLKDYYEYVNSDRELIEELKDKIRRYYHENLDGMYRANFVNHAKQLKVPEELIGEYLWNETQQKIQESQNFVEYLKPILQDHIKAGRGTQGPERGYFNSTLLPILIKEMRTGIPQEAINELRRRFEQACDEEMTHGGDATKLQILTKIFTDEIVKRLLPEDRIAEDPFEDARGHQDVDITNVNLVEGNRINYGSLKKSIIGFVESWFPNVEVSRKDILVQELFQGILKNLREHMPDIIEINKMEREAERLNAKVKSLRVDYWKLWAKDALKLVGGASTILLLRNVLKNAGIDALVSFMDSLGNVGGQIAIVGIPAMMWGIYERWRVHEDTREKMKQAAAELEGAELEITSKVSSIAEKRGIQLRKQRSHFDGFVRSVLRSALPQGRESLETRHEYLRRELTNTQAPELAQFAVA